MKKPILTICASIHFYKQVAEIQEELEKQGITVLVPETVNLMRAANDFEVSNKFKPDISQPHWKAKLMHGHFDKVAKADATLVVNNTKNGKDNYIGGNVLMEMALAFHLNQPIFLLNDIPEESPYLEEIIGVEPIVLKGSLEKLVEKLKPN